MYSVQYDNKLITLPDLAAVVHMPHVMHQFWWKQTNVVFVNLEEILMLRKFHSESHHNDHGIALAARNKH